jgi:AcrR family transcriptional regulator
MNQKTHPAPKVHLTFDELSSVQTGRAARLALQRVELRQQRQARQAAQRREHMLDAAFALFQETGLQGFNMRELGHRAGYTPGALYAYFDGKAAILQALRDRLLNQLTVEFQRSGSRHRTGVRDRGGRAGAMADPVDAAAAAFLSLCEVWWHWLAQDPLRLRLLLAVDQPVAAPRPRPPAEPDTSAAAACDEPSLLQQLCQATLPCTDALQAMGLPAEQADRLHEASLVWGIGLLVLHAQQADAPILGERFMEGVRQRLVATLPAQGSAAPDALQRPQGNLFGR